MTYCEDDLLPISTLQHLIFCERQCALIHIEQIWVENLFTGQGRVMHDRMYWETVEQRRDVRVEFGMPIRFLASS
ncbi:MAG: Dna2/Cas4 domain-containing protein [Candidatus Omnitrophica bacterium]|nr:Dna2/Cas4 domain-containing protein [Candidatus Omnitrophota bacterium]